MKLDPHSVLPWALLTNHVLLPMLLPAMFATAWLEYFKYQTQE